VILGEPGDATLVEDTGGQIGKAVRERPSR
jgi:hypothetical protein